LRKRDDSRPKPDLAYFGSLVRAAEAFHEFVVTRLAAVLRVKEDLQVDDGVSQRVGHLADADRAFLAPVIIRSSSAPKRKEV